MADKNSFDHAASDLLCSEGVFDDPETVAMVTDEKDHHQTTDKALSSGNGGGSGPMIAFPCLSEEKFVLMVKEEKNHLPKDDYLERLRTGVLDMSVRRQALDWILKAHAQCGFGELAFYLSVNYLDRFLSFHELPGGKTWAVQLLAVACLSLGAKMAEIKVPLVVDLQVGDPKFVFEAKTIRRMELILLSSLEWRMYPCTPYSFIDYFLKKSFGLVHDDVDDQQPLSEALMSKAVKLILCTIKGIDFLEFKPSEVAAAVALLVVAGETQAIDIEKAMSCCLIHVEKERVVKCYKLLEYMTLMMRSSGSGVGIVVPHSPNGVLEAEACLSYKSDETTTVGSCPNTISSNNNSPDTKKKKIDTGTTTASSSSSSSFGNNNCQKK